MERRRLNSLAKGETAKVAGMEPDFPLTRRLLDLGLTKGTEIHCLFTGLGGNITAYCIRGAVIAIRSRDARRIYLSE